MMSKAIGLIILIVAATAWMAKAEDKGQTSVLDNLKYVPGDEEGNEKKALRAELLVSATEQKAIAQIQMLIRKYKGGELEAGLQFRLAEMYMRKSKTDRFFEIHRESPTVVKLAPRLVRTSSSRNSLTQAVDVYQYIEKKFPHYDQLDVVIFNHAFAKQALGDDKLAETLYWELIKRFSDSVLVPDAHLAIGEIAFLKAQFPIALEHFDAIRKFPESRVYPYGLYKAAWTRYNLRDAAGGLKNLEEVVAYGDYVIKNKIEARLDLRKEALGDMALFFEDVNPAKEAYNYFRKQAGNEDLPPTLMRLIDLYERHARYVDEREVLQQFVSHLTDSTLIPQARNKLIMTADSMKRKDMAVADLEDFVKDCSSRSDFVKAHPDQAKACLETLQKTSLVLAQKWLKIWNKNPYDASYADMAEKSFEVFLRFKRTDEEFVKAHFLYAELLFKRSKFREASDHYAVVSESKLDQIGHDSAYAACLALENAVGDKWSEKDEKRFNELAHVYVGQYPTGKYRLEIEFKMAFLAYEKNRYDEAAPIFFRLGNQFAKDEKGLKAQDLYLDILNIKKDYSGIRSYTQGLMKKSMATDRTAKLTHIYEQAYFLQIQKMEETGDLKTALHEYQSFTKDNPTSDLAEKASWNMMQLHYKTNDAYGGANASLEFAKKFPKSEQSTPALVRAASTFEQMGQLGQAAAVIRQLADRDVAGRAKWWELAADFYALSGHSQDARKLYQDLLSGATKEDEKVRLLTKMEVFEKSYGTEQSHGAIVKQLVQKGVAPYAGQAKMERFDKTLADSNAAERFQESKRMLGTSDLSPAEKAKVRLVQAQILEDEFVSQSVKAKPDRLAIVLGIKTEKLSKAEQAYQSVIRFGDSTTALQAMEHLYHCFDHYVTALRSIPAPEGMSAAEVQAFQKELQNLIIPLEEKSVETLAQALAFAKKNQVTDGTVAHLEDELAKANHQAQMVNHVAINNPAMVVPVEERSSL